MRKRAATDKSSRLNHLKSIFPYLVLITLLILSVLVWQYYKGNALAREERRYNEYVEAVVNDITERLDKHQMILRGGAGLFPASEEVTRAEWRAYYEYQQVSTLYPGIQRVTFSKIVRPWDLAQHIEEIRAEGFPDYTVWPAGEHELYAPLIYLEPFDEGARGALGFDLFSEPVRRAAIEQARDTGEAVLSQMVVLVSEETQGSRPGFLIVVPVYDKGDPMPDTVKKRRAGIYGYVIGAFTMSELMAGIFADPIHIIDFAVYDGAEVSPATLMYDSRVFSDTIDEEHQQLFTSQKTVDLHGHQWTMVFKTTPAFEAVADFHTQWAVLAAGLLVSILIFLYLKSLTTTGDRAHTLAQKMTNELRESEQRTTRQRAAITGLVLDDIVIAGEIIPALRKITEALSGAVSIERAGIWVLDESGEELQCLSLYETKSGEHSSGTILQTKTFPRYFAAILEESRINVENAQEDPRTSELAEGYLKPLGITSMLDASIIIDGKLKGVISLEHVGDPRKWHADEETFASTLASMAAQVFIVAERKQLEEALQQSEENYRFLTENIIDIIWAADLEGNLTYISPAVEKMLGFTPEEITAMSMDEYTVREDYDALMARLAEELAKPPEDRAHSTFLEARYKTKDNHLVFVELSASWIIDEQGNYIGIQGTTRDITERKKLEEKIIESKKMYQSVVDTQQEMIRRYMPDTSLTFVNDAYCRYYGKNRQEMLGHRFLEFTPLELHDEILEVINSLTPDNPIVRHEHYVLLPDGSIRWQEWAEQAFFTKKGEIKEFQGVGRDITERRQAEDNLLKAYDVTIEGWAHALDLKDKETEDHSQRVTKLTLRIAREMGVKDVDLAHVRRGALLHDIGKMGIPDAILLKPGKLSDEEWELMKKHPVDAFEMLAPIDYLRPALDIPYCHHEKWDGSGYPRGLKGKEIPLPARIFAVVDVYDALTSDRPYRKAWSENEALEHIKNESGKHFDPDVVEMFLKEIGNQT